MVTKHKATQNSKRYRMSRNELVNRICIDWIITMIVFGLIVILYGGLN